MLSGAEPVTTVCLFPCFTLLDLCHCIATVQLTVYSTMGAYEQPVYAAKCICSFHYAWKPAVAGVVPTSLRVGISFRLLLEFESFVLHSRDLTFESFVQFKAE